VSDILKAVLLGIIQGLTEFLPISSTGHLVIVEAALGLSEDDFGLRFDAAIHLGTLAAVLVYFRATLFGLLLAWLDSLRRRRWAASDDARLAWLLLIGTLPAAAIGYFIEGTVEDTFRSPALVATMLIVFSLPLVLAERLTRGLREVESATVKDVLLVGVAQSIALVPGVSRSGITIAAGMVAGFRRDQAAVFAFLLSAPIIVGAGGKQLFDIARGENTATGLDNEVAVYAAGLTAAAVVGYAAIHFLVRYLRVNPLYVFVAYRLVLGTLVLALAAGGLL
jgi:undecaprenyl-diphosphatase